MKEHGHVQYCTTMDEEVINCFFELNSTEGIILVLESAHDLAYAMKVSKTLPKDNTIVVNLSGSSDKDLDYLYNLHGIKYRISKESALSGAVTITEDATTSK